MMGCSLAVGWRVDIVFLWKDEMRYRLGGSVWK